MAEKMTWMVLKVDLECPCCYKKIKKILCKFPEIKDQAFQMEHKLVKITVVSCCPENIRDRLYRKGGKVIQSIAIIKPPEPTKESTNKVNETGKPNEQGPTIKTKSILEKPPPPATPPAPVSSAGIPPTPAVLIPAQASTPEIPPTLAVPIPAAGYPVPPGFWCPRCCGYIGPCYCNYGRVLQPPPRPPCYGKYYGYGYVYDK